MTGIGMNVTARMLLMMTTIILLAGCATSGTTPDLPSVNTEAQLESANQAKLDAAVYQ